MRNIKTIDDFINESEENDYPYTIDFDFEIEDTLDERARPPKLKKKQREANAVKSKVTKELLGPDSKFRPLINKIFKKFEKEIKKEAAKQGVPPARIKLDKLTIKK